MTPKKQAAVGSNDGVQSEQDRRSAEAEVSALVAEFASAHASLVAATRRWLQARLPTAHEVVYEYRDAFVISYAPDGRGYEAALALHGSAKGVLLYFNRGKDLPDPAKLLKGSGNQTRSIQLEAATLARPDVASLVDAAIARNPVPYAPTGRGTVVIRATSARKRRPAQSEESP
jgi:hypothetical protein